MDETTPAVDTSASIGESSLTRTGPLAWIRDRFPGIRGLRRVIGAGAVLLALGACSAANEDVNALPTDTPSVTATPEPSETATTPESPAAQTLDSLYQVKASPEEVALFESILSKSDVAIDNRPEAAQRAADLLAITNETVASFDRMTDDQLVGMGPEIVSRYNEADRARGILELPDDHQAMSQDAYTGGTLYETVDYMNALQEMLGQDVAVHYQWDGNLEYPDDSADTLKLTPFNPQTPEENALLEQALLKIMQSVHDNMSSEFLNKLSGNLSIYVGTLRTDNGRYSSAQVTRLQDGTIRLEIGAPTYVQKQDDSLPHEMGHIIQLSDTEVSEDLAIQYTFPNGFTPGIEVSQQLDAAYNNLLNGDQPDGTLAPDYVTPDGKTVITTLQNTMNGAWGLRPGTQIIAVNNTSLNTTAEATADGIASLYDHSNPARIFVYPEQSQILYNQLAIELSRMEAGGLSNTAEFARQNLTLGAWEREIDGRINAAYDSGQVPSQKLVTASQQTQEALL